MIPIIKADSIWLFHTTPPLKRVYVVMIHDSIIPGVKDPGNDNAMRYYAILDANS